jgi:hypothetical protein
MPANDATRRDGAVVITVKAPEQDRGGNADFVASAAASAVGVTGGFTARTGHAFREAELQWRRTERFPDLPTEKRCVVLCKQEFQVGRMNLGEVGSVDVPRLAQHGGVNLCRASSDVLGIEGRRFNDLEEVHVMVVHNRNLVRPLSFEGRDDSTGIV